MSIGIYNILARAVFSNNNRKFIMEQRCDERSLGALKSNNSRRSGTGIINLRRIIYNMPLIRA